MKLHPGQVFIHPEKLTGYLLNINHPDGGPKAKLLLAFGFEAAKSEELRDAIIELIKISKVKNEIVTDFGEKYIVEGNLNTPSKKEIVIRSVWVKEKGKEMVNFVTLYPI